MGKKIARKITPFCRCLPGIFLSLHTSVFAVKYEKNLEEYGFSSQTEHFRQRVGMELSQTLPTTSRNSAIPDPILPKLSDNYSDLVPPPTKPTTRTFYQPAMKDYVPDSRENFTKDREERIRNYQRPPDFNAFLQKHENVGKKIVAGSEFGLSGLFRTVGGEIGKKGDYYFHAGLSHMKFDRVLGEKVDKGSLTKFEVPLGLSGVIADQFEMALRATVVNEKSLSFPLLNDFEKTELEEISMFAKYQFFDNPAYNLKSAFGFGVENALGKQVTRRGSDGTSYTGFLSLTKDYQKLSVHSQLGFTMASGYNDTGNEQPNNLFYNVGMEAPVARNTRVLLEFNGFDWSGYGNNLDLTLGARYQVREEFSLQIAAPITIMRAQFPHDYDHYVSIGASLKL